jgi:hypothetical protein
MFKISIGKIVELAGSIKPVAAVLAVIGLPILYVTTAWLGSEGNFLKYTYLLLGLAYCMLVAYAEIRKK